MMVVKLVPGRTSLACLEALYRAPAMACEVELDDSTRSLIEESASRIAKVSRGDQAVYGVNTGFGKLAGTRIDAADVEQLQRNLVRSHSAGIGKPLPWAIVRLVMVLKVLSLGRGASGVRVELLLMLQSMLARGVYPVCPEKGSVGASGDLAPLAHLASCMIGEGLADTPDGRKPAKEALEQAGLTPITLQAKEGLAILNGTQVSTALALAGLFEAWRCLQSACVVGALAVDAAKGSSTPFDARIHHLRGHAGQIAVARWQEQLIEDSDIRDSHLDDDERVQDPYCLRCQPQVLGACLDTLVHVARILSIEANAATDNPLILEDGSVVSGGNFHGAPIGLAADSLALAIAEVGSIIQRQIALLVDPVLSTNLPAFLTPNPGLHSGFMVPEIASAAVMSENRHLANPCSIDSTPTGANQEDHVAMSCHAARRLLDMNDNLSSIIAIAWLVAAQGVELRAPLTTSPRLASVVAKLRSDIPALSEDRYLADDLALATKLVRDGALIENLDIEGFHEFCYPAHATY